MTKIEYLLKLFLRTLFRVFYWSWAFEFWINSQFCKIRPTTLFFVYDQLKKYIYTLSYNLETFGWKISISWIHLEANFAFCTFYGNIETQYGDFCSCKVPSLAHWAELSLEEWHRQTDGQIRGHIDLQTRGRLSENLHIIKYANLHDTS